MLAKEHVIQDIITRSLTTSKHASSKNKEEFEKGVRVAANKAFEMINQEFKLRKEMEHELYKTKDGIQSIANVIKPYLD